MFDDLTKPNPNISDNARTYVYDRLLFDTDFSFDSYQTALKNAGFTILEAVDLSAHLKTSYQCLGKLAEAKGDEHQGKYQELRNAYDQMVQAIEIGDLGWGLYLCQK